MKNFNFNQKMPKSFNDIKETSEFYHVLLNGKLVGKIFYTTVKAKKAVFPNVFCVELKDYVSNESLTMKAHHSFELFPEKMVFLGKEFTEKELVNLNSFLSLLENKGFILYRF